MITIIGVEHALQFEMANINPVAAAVEKDNASLFLTYVKTLLLERNIQIAGEEDGIGLLLNEFIKMRYGCEVTVLQEIIANTNIEYFQFDLPKDQLAAYGIEPTIEDILQKKNLVPAQDREVWFDVLISKKISRTCNGLVLMGVDHMPRLATMLTSRSYSIECVDATKCAWYKDPTQEALNNFFNTTTRA